MKRRTFVKVLPVVTMLAGTSSSSAQDLHPITLPEPEKDGGGSVLTALQKRRTTRNVSSKPLPPEMLSTLLWAVWLRKTRPC